MDYQLGPGPLQVDQNTIDEKIKGDIGIVENGDVATHAIPSGYYVIWKGDLYVAKTDISSGTTLSAASNGNLTAKPNGLGAEVAGLASGIANLSADSVISDCNAITVTGVYKAINSTTNTPVASSHYVIYHTQYDSTIEATQLAIKTGSNETFTRTKTSGAWTSWSKLALNNDLSNLGNLFGCVQYNASTDRTVESNRTDAIEYLLTNYFSKHYHFAMVRYMSGYYHGYICIGEYNDILIVEITHNLSEKVIFWRKSSGSTTWSKIGVLGT